MCPVCNATGSWLLQGRVEWFSHDEGWRNEHCNPAPRPVLGR